MGRSLFSQSSSDDQQYMFCASVDNTRDIYLLLSTIQFKETAIICASSDGVKVTVEYSKCVQANAFVPSSLFEEYEVKETFVAFEVNLAVLLECLNIFGTNNIPNTVTMLKIRYAGYGLPLILLLEENGVVTECQLKTYEVKDMLDFEFSSENVANKIVMKSELLKEAWTDLDMTRNVLQVLMSPSDPYFQMSTADSLGTISINFSKESEEIEFFQCTQTQKNSYQISLLKSSVKALHHSTKISLRTDERGILCLQYMIKSDGGHACFVEYICIPDVSLEDGNQK